MSDKSQADELFEIMLAAVEDTGRQLQLMIDTVVAVQDVMPMPESGWEQFVADVEYTNKKHNLNLRI